MTNKETLAYLAGIIDGEGYIGVKKTPPGKERHHPGYHARIQVRMVDEPAIALLTDTLGGNYYAEKPHTARGRPLFCWQASDRIAETILQTVRPWLRVKAANADRVLDLRRLQAKGRQHRTKVVGHREFKGRWGQNIRVPTKAFSDEYVAQLDAIYEDCKALNATGALA